MPNYPDMSSIRQLVEAIQLQAQLKVEYGAQGTGEPIKRAEEMLRATLAALEGLPNDPVLAAREPNDLDAIHALRRSGPRRLWTTFDRDTYVEHVEGAFLGRMAGCTLGAPVEFSTIARMAALAEENGDDFPPTDYWSYVPEPELERYEMSPRRSYTRPALSGVPVDDDTIYTLLGLLMV